MNNKFSECENVECYLEGAKIIRFYTANNHLRKKLLEGGQVIVFEKDEIVGIYIMGYTELGNWVYHVEYGFDLYFDDFYIDEINQIRNENGFYSLEAEDTDE